MGDDIAAFHFHTHRLVNMSSIMRGDQTVSLIQLYHAHYPEIARNTQDSEGRNQRVNMWKKIAEELNAQFNTNFTVEQFKKKVQNVQCTSRQKVQNNKRNLGDAEMEYMRLFENERLKNLDVLPSKFSTYVDDLANQYRSVSRTSLNNNNNASIIDDFNISKCKIEQMMEDYGINNNNSNNFEGEKHFDEEAHGGEGDEDDVRSRSTPGTSGSGGSTGNGNILSNVSNASNSNNGSGTSLLSNFDQAQQLILAMMANATNNLTAEGNETSNNNNNASGKNISETLLATINAARRKRVAAVVDTTNNNNNNGFLNNNLNNNNVVANSFNNENINCNNSNNNSSTLPAKRRRKQAHALHLSHLRPTEPFLPVVEPTQDSANTTLNNNSPLSNVISTLPSNGVGTNNSIANNSYAQENGNWNLAFNSSTNASVNGNKWRSEVFEMQKNILENQRRILDIIERQTIHQQEERELRRQRFNSQSPPLNARQQQRQNSSQLLQDSTVSVFLGADDSHMTSTFANNNRSETILLNLCDKIGKLSETLCSIDETIKSHFPRKSLPNAEIVNGAAELSIASALENTVLTAKTSFVQLGNCIKLKQLPTSNHFNTLEAEAVESIEDSINDTVDNTSLIQDAGIHKCETVLSNKSAVNLTGEGDVDLLSLSKLNDSKLLKAE